jgi:glucan phosphoethanolaminetransferase (alkaline phosphatase superfamily)
MSIIKAFLAVFAVGGLFCGAAWVFARRRIQQSWRWRAPFCFLIAASVTPSAIKISKSWAPIPAVFIVPVIISDANDMRFGLLFGMLPIFVVASIIFVVWTIILRRHSHVA